MAEKKAKAKMGRPRRDQPKRGTLAYRVCDLWDRGHTVATIAARIERPQSACHAPLNRYRPRWKQNRH